MVVAFYFRLHLAYFPRPVVAIFARPEQRVTRFTDKMVPVMAIGYKLMVLFLIAVNFNRIPDFFVSFLVIL